MRVNKKIVADLANFIQMRYNISVTEFQETYPELFKTFMRMQFWLDEVTLSKYFSGPNPNAEEEGVYWTQQLKFATRRTGQQLLDKLRELQDNYEDPMKIIDVGCGENEWKTHLGARVTGIDPHHSNADFKIGINEYAQDHADEFDIVLALGSINFGDQAEIERQKSNVVKLCKGGGKIFWRCNPGITHDNPEAQWVDFFPWSEEFMRDIAQKLGCTIDDFGWDHEDDEDPRWGNRLYAEWTKNPFNTL